MLASSNTAQHQKASTIENSQTLVPLNEKKIPESDPAWGNFYMAPNGVFLIDAKGAEILAASHYTTANKKPRIATQSGPLLVLNNKLHPKFRKHSKSLRIRIGVGVNKKGEVVFALSMEAVNFHHFASLFKKQLHCPSALFLDGDLCKMVVPPEDKIPFTGTLGAMFIVTEPAS